MVLVHLALAAAVRVSKAQTVITVRKVVVVEVTALPTASLDHR